MTAPKQVLDCIVIGAGMAGLSAAHRLSTRNILVLEESDRPGGRVHSEATGDYWLNFGAHMFGGSDTPVGDLISELDLPAAPIRGRLMGLAFGGRRFLHQRPEIYPFILPLTLRERLGMMRMGAQLRWGSNRYLAHMARCDSDDTHQRQHHALSFRNTQTLGQAIGSLPPRIATFLTAITERNGADPEDMAAGHAMRSFANVWSSHAPGRNIIGGSALLPQGLAGKLGDRRISYRSPVVHVAADANGVVVRYRRNGVDIDRRARTAILAVPAPVAARIAPGLPEATLAALQAIRYGPFLSVAISTHETGPMPWDGHYAIATPGRRFSVLFNMATTLRGGPRQPGGSLMLFRGARGAAALMEESDASIEQAFRQDLTDLFPEAKGVLGEGVVQRWPLGAPYAAPGRTALQPALTAPLGRLFLAGDYMEFPNMEAAVISCQDAGYKALSLLSISHRPTAL